MSEEQTFIELPERNNLYEVDEELEEGAKLCEKFLLLPDRYKDRETKVRLMLRNKFCGWTLKDELVVSLGLTVGDTVSVEVSIIGGPGLISENGDVDLFACGDVANSLLDIACSNKGPENCIVDCKVRLTYEKAPITSSNKLVFKAFVVLEEIIDFVGVDDGFGRVDRARSSLADFVLANLQ